MALIPTKDFMANTKSIEDKTERKKVKRAARKKAAPKAKRTTPRGSNKKKVRKLVRGQKQAVVPCYTTAGAVNFLSPRPADQLHSLPSILLPGAIVAGESLAAIHGPEEINPGRSFSRANRSTS